MAHTQAVVVNGLERVLEELGYASRIGDSDAHEGIDAQFGGEPSFLGGPNLLFFLEQGIETLDKIGVCKEESIVELLVESLEIVVGELVGSEGIASALIFPGSDLVIHLLLEIFHRRHIFRNHQIDTYKVAVAQVDFGFEFFVRFFELQRHSLSLAVFLLKFAVDSTDFANEFVLALPFAIDYITKDADYHQSDRKQGDKDRESCMARLERVSS